MKSDNSNIVNQPVAFQKIMGHAAIYSLARLGPVALGFFLIPLYTRVIGTEGYGILTLLDPVREIIGLLILQGMAGSIFRLRFNCDSPEESQTLVTSIFWYVLISGFLFLGLLLIFGPTVFPLILPNIPFFPLLAITITGAVGSSLMFLTLRKLQADQKPVPYVILSLFRTLLQFALILSLVLWFSRGARGQVEAVAISSLVTSAIALWFLRPSGISKVSGKVLKSALSYGWRIQPHQLLMIANRYLDRILVNMFMGLGSAGVYALGSNVASLLQLVTISLNEAYAPVYAKTIRKSESSSGDEQKFLRQEIAWKAMRVVTVVCFFAIFGTAISREVLHVIATEDFARSWTIVAPVSASIVLSSCYQIFAQGVTYNQKRVHLLPLISGCGVAVNIVVGLYLLPRLGMLGGTVGFGLSNLIMMLFVLRVGQHHLKIPYSWPRWTMMIMMTYSLLGGIWFLDYLELSISVSMPAKFLLVLVSVPSLLLCNGLGLKDISKVISGVLSTSKNSSERNNKS